MKKAAFIFIFLAFFASSVSAQMKEAQKIDEFETTNCEDIKVRLDGLSIALLNEPQAKGYVIVYEGKYAKYVYDRKGNSKFRYVLPTFGDSVYRSQFMQSYLFRNRGLAKEKVLFISGGYQENHKVEFWIAPPGVSPPKPMPTLKTMKYRKGKPINLYCGEG